MLQGEVTMKDSAAESDLGWDPYEVWRTLLLENPDLLVQRNKSEDGPEGLNDPELVKQFAMTIAEFPDDLQDFLFMLAQEYGVEAAHNALDDAVRLYYSAQKDRIPLKNDMKA